MKSMTGCAIRDIEFDGYSFRYELKSVNNRFFDVYLKTPYEFSDYEIEIKNILKSKVKRGKLSFFISFESTEELGYSIAPDINIAKCYLEGSENIKKELGLKGGLDINSFLLLSSKDIWKKKKESKNEELLKEYLFRGLEDVVDIFNESRQKEGDFLKQFFDSSLNELSGFVRKIENSSKNFLQEKIILIKDKMSRLLLDIPLDENRILTEAAYYSEKTDISEEIVRLNSHIFQFKTAIDSEGDMGKRLDFIIQEMMREANTIGSKASDTSIVNIVIDMKCLIEKMREQVQNVE